MAKQPYFLTDKGVNKVNAGFAQFGRGAVQLDRNTIRKLRKGTGGVNRVTLERLCDGFGWDFQIELQENIHYYKLQLPAPKETPQNPMLGRILRNRYRIIQHLGSGEFSQTYLAEDVDLPGKPLCVVKQLRSQSYERATRVFDREATVLYQLGKHNQIPSLFAHFKEEEDFYLVHQFIEGQLLSKELIEGQPWSESRVIALVQDILETLMFVHQQNVIYRDIKPQNLIRRGSDNKIVWTNFGSVKQISPGQTRTFSSTNDGYIPPEQGSGVPQLCSDIYAVGILSIQALTGLHPRRLKADYHTGNIVWREQASQVSPKLVNILNNMVRYDFRTRYPSAAEALQALQGL